MAKMNSCLPFTVLRTEDMNTVMLIDYGNYLKISLSH